MDCQAVRNISLDAKYLFIDYMMTVMIIHLTIINIVLRYIKNHGIKKITVYKFHSNETNDEIAIHRDGLADDGGRLTAVNAGNLEDGLEHTICITYTPGTRILAVTIDGNPLLSYDLGPTYNLQTYFHFHQY